MWGLGTGTNHQITPGSWGTGAGVQSSGTVNIIANAGATFEFTGVQLEKGPTATDFEHKPIGTELALCQRYYQILTQIMNSGYTTSGTSQTFTGILPVKMRTTPAMSWTVATMTGGTVTAVSAFGPDTFQLQNRPSVNPGSFQCNLTDVKFDAEL